MMSDGEVKIVDFGFSTHLNNQYQYVNSMVGKDLYIAPEVLLGLDYSAQKADVYSYGCLVQFLIAGTPTYNQKKLSAYS